MAEAAKAAGATTAGASGAAAAAMKHFFRIKIRVHKILQPQHLQDSRSYNVSLHCECKRQHPALGPRITTCLQRKMNYSHVPINRSSASIVMMMVVVAAAAAKEVEEG